MISCFETKDNIAWRRKWRLFPQLIKAKQTKGPFGLREEGGGMEGSRVELAENRLILGQLYYTLLPLPPPQPKWTLHDFFSFEKPNQIFLIQFNLNYNDLFWFKGLFQLQLHSLEFGRSILINFSDKIVCKLVHNEELRIDVKPLIYA